MFCPKCGGPLDQNGVCQNCNKPPKKKFPTWAIVLICVFGGLIVLGVFVAIFGEPTNNNSSSSSSSISDSSVPASGSDSSSEESSSESSESQEDVIKVSAYDLYAEYDANEAAAEQKYKGKLLEITGTVDDVSRDILDDLYVTLESSDDKYSLSSVQCYLDEKDESTMTKVTSLSKGDTVTIRGYVDSMLFNLSVKKCIIVE